MFGRLALAGVLLGCGSSSSPSPSAQPGSAVEAPRDVRVFDARVLDAPAADAEVTAEPVDEPAHDPADDDMACSPDDPRCTGPLENAHKLPTRSRK